MHIDGGFSDDFEGSDVDELAAAGEAGEVRHLALGEYQHGADRHWGGTARPSMVRRVPSIRQLEDLSSRQVYALTGLDDLDF